MPIMRMEPRDRTASKADIRYNSVLRLEHFSDPEFSHDCRRLFRHLDVGHEDFPRGHENAKIWETVQAWRAFRDFGIIGEEREILGIGAGAEALVFFLTNHVRRVFATDLYGTLSDWQSGMHEMLIEPSAHCPPLMRFRRQRLVVQHMDALDLRYEDESFDGIFSCGSIEHFGGLKQAAQAAREMARVLKPGGIAAISTEFRIRGPNRPGIPGTVIFTPAMLQRAIIGPSGLEPVDEMELETDVGPYCYPLLEAIQQGIRPRSLCISHGGFTWTSVSICLRKPARRVRNGRLLDRRSEARAKRGRVVRAGAGN